MAYLLGLHDRTKKGAGRTPTRKIAGIIGLEPAVVTELASSRVQDDPGELPTVSQKRRKELREGLGVKVEPKKPAESAKPGTELVAQSSLPPHPVDQIDWSQVTVSVTIEGQEAAILPPMPVAELIHMAAKSAYDLGVARTELIKEREITTDLQQLLVAARAEADKYRSVAVLELTRNGAHG